MPLKQGKTSQHHNWPRYMDYPQIGPKSAIKLGEKRRKDKWYLFCAPTAPPPKKKVKTRIFYTDTDSESGKGGGISVTQRGAQQRGAQANASKRKQTQTNADKRKQTRRRKRKQTQANAEAKTQANANKRLHPPLLRFFYTPPCNPQMEDSGAGKTYHETPPEKRFGPPPTYDTFPPPVCSRSVIFLQGNGHRPDQSLFLRPPKLGLEGALYSTFSPSQNHTITFCP